MTKPKVDKWIPIYVVLIMTIVCAVAMGSTFATDIPSTANGEIGDLNNTTTVDINNTTNTTMPTINNTNNTNPIIPNITTNTTNDTNITPINNTPDISHIYVNNNQTENGNGTIDNPYNNIKDAIIHAKDGSIIIISGGNYLTDSSININKNITIQAKDSTVIINGNNNHNIFNINKGNSLTLINLILENGKANNGGAINNNGVLYIINCTF